MRVECVRTRMCVRSVVLVVHGCTHVCVCGGGEMGMGMCVVACVRARICGWVVLCMSHMQAHACGACACANTQLLATTL
jgi:hypothetical protein